MEHTIEEFVAGGCLIRRTVLPGLSASVCFGIIPAATDGGATSRRPPCDAFDLLEIDRDLMLAQWRGVSIDRLPNIFANGVDVTPTDAVIFADAFDKAWEYGGLPKVLLAYRNQLIEPSFKVLAADASQPERDETQKTYPTYVEQTDGSHWYSRMDPDRGRRPGSPYEMAYGRWIPGNAHDALIAVFIFGTVQELQSISLDG